MRLIFIFLSAFLVSNFAFTQKDIPQNLRKKPTITGNASIGGFAYKTNRRKSALSPFGYAMNFNANANLYGLDIPIQLSLNEQGSAFQNPFNRFGMSPKYKWITAHLGHRNYNWSEFVMAGATIYGLGLELKPGAFRLAAVSGRMRKAQGPNEFNFGIPQFTRKVQAAMIGGESDFNSINLMVLRGKDDLNSLTGQSDEILGAIEAAENLSAGATLKMSFWADKIFATFDGGVSGYTDDIRLPAIDIDSVFNTGLKLNNLMKFNAGTNGTFASKSALNFNFSNFSIAGIYRKVLPEFRTFGANYLLTDIESITVNPSFSFWKNKAAVSGSYGIQYNNLDENLTEKTTRNIGSVDLSINPSPKYGAFFQYSNYSLYQQVIKDSLANDSILIDQINHNFSFSPRLTFVNPERVHNLIFSFNYQLLDDKNAVTSLYSENDLFSATGNYILNFVRTDFSINTGFNYLKFNSNLFSSNQLGLLAGLGKKLFNKKLTLGLNMNYSILETDISKNNLLTLTGNASYRLVKKSSVNFQFYFLNNQSELNPIQESRSQINYRYSF